MKTVITIKVFRRPYYFRDLVISLQKYGIGDLPIMLSVDRWNDKSAKEFEEAIKHSTLKDSTEIIVHNSRQGCAGNMRYCFDYAFKNNKYDRMIHLEEDVIIGGDYFKWMNWALDYMDENENIFACCPSRRKCRGGSLGKLEDSIITNYFECQGGFGINRKQWEYIESLGGIFGCIGTITSDPPEEWKKKMRITDDGSWAWPFNCYFLRERLCLHPKVGRANNVGGKEGRFNLSEDWHKVYIYDDKWIGSEKYNQEFSNIVYNKPEIVL
jgi:hypothetical protein